MANCNRCGKKLGFLEVSKFYGICKECNTKSNRDYEEWGAKQRKIREEERKKAEATDINPNATCIFCGYINEQKHAMEHVDEFGNVCDDTFTTYRCSKFGIDIDKYNWGNARKCTSYLSTKKYEEKCLNGEIKEQKANVQIILDFSSLKDVMAKGGLVMSTYKCPNCNGMVKLPEEGKVLVCEYCGTPIKPVDVFEKIKSLIQ